MTKRRPKASHKATQDSADTRESAPLTNPDNEAVRALIAAYRDQADQAFREVELEDQVSRKALEIVLRNIEAGDKDLALEVVKFFGHQRRARPPRGATPEG